MDWKFAKLMVDGVEYTLAYDFNQICKAEEYLGINLLAAIDNLQSVNAGQLRGLFWAALESGPEQAFPGKNRQQSLEMVGSLIRMDTLERIVRALSEAYTLSVAQPDEEEETEVAV